MVNVIIVIFFAILLFIVVFLSIILFPEERCPDCGGGLFYYDDKHRGCEECDFFERIW